MKAGSTQKVTSLGQLSKDLKITLYNTEAVDKFVEEHGLHIVFSEAYGKGFRRYITTVQANELRKKFAAAEKAAKLKALTPPAAHASPIPEVTCTPDALLDVYANVQEMRNDLQLLSDSMAKATRELIEAAKIFNNHMAKISMNTSSVCRELGVVSQ